MQAIGLSSLQRATIRVSLQRYCRPHCSARTLKCSSSNEANLSPFGTARPPGLTQSCIGAKVRRKRRARSRTCVSASLSLVPASSGTTLWAILAACAALGQILGNRTEWGAKISAPLLAMGSAMLLSSAGVIPSAAPAYDTVWAFVMPMALCLSLLETDVRNIFNDAGPTFGAFVFGAIGTIVGTFAAHTAFGGFLGPTGWKIAACLCATYIGGSVNFAATAQAVGLASGSSTLAAAMAADNVAMTLYFAVLMSWPVPQEEAAKIPRESAEKHDQVRMSVESISTALAAAALALAGGELLGAKLPPSFSGMGLALMAFLASCLSSGTAFFTNSRQNGPKVTAFAGAETMGGALMLLFFTVVGATANLKDAIFGGWPLPAFIVLLLTVHYLVIYILGKLFKVPIRSILIASNANVGGPATAAAMATSKGWPAMVQPAMLTGTLGYIVGTAVGCLVGQCLQ